MSKLTDEEIEKVAATARAKVVDVLKSDGYRGGPLQREYPPIIIQTMADAVAGAVTDTLEEIE